MKSNNTLYPAIIILGSVLVCVFAAVPAFADVLWNEDHSTAIFYPTNMTYVDRASPLVDFGSEDVLKVGDDRGAPFQEDGTVYFDAVNAKRAYLRFSTQELQSVFADYDITGATLNLRLSSVIDGAGTATSSDAINVRQVTAADSYGYISGLTWDGQADRGVSYSGGTLFADRTFLVSGESGGWKEWEMASSGTGSVAAMVEGWYNGTIPNYGVVLENDFDGKWQELVNATKYSIDNPAQMNELTAIFYKQENSYPFLKVNVAPKIVPEPASFILALAGFGVFGIAGRRKKK